MKTIKEKKEVIKEKQRKKKKEPLTYEKHKKTINKR